MRIGSIVYSTNTAAFFIGSVIGQEGAAIRVQSLQNFIHGEAGDEFVLEPGQFHRVKDKTFEETVQAAYGLNVGDHLPNPNKPTQAEVNYNHPLDYPNELLGIGEDEEEDEEDLDEEEEEEEK